MYSTNNEERSVASERFIRTRKNMSSILKNVYIDKLVAPWCSGYHHCATLFRFCAGSNPARGVSKIGDGEDL